MRRLQLNSWEFASAPRGRDGDLRAAFGWPLANLIKKVQAHHFLNFLLASTVSGDRVYLFARQMILRLKGAERCAFIYPTGTCRALSRGLVYWDLATSENL